VTSSWGDWARWAGINLEALGDYADVATQKVKELISADQPAFLRALRGGYLGQHYKELKGEIADSAQAAVAHAKAIDDSARALDDLNTQFDRGDLGMSDYIAKLESMRHQYRSLSESELAGVTDALRDAQDAQRDMVESAVDGLNDWKAKLYEIHGQEVELQNLNWQQDRLEVERALNTARANGNAAEIAALEAQIILIDEYYRTKVIEAQRAEERANAAVSISALQSQFDAQKRVLDAAATDALDRGQAVQTQIDGLAASITGLDAEITRQESAITAAAATALQSQIDAWQTVRSASTETLRSQLADLDALTAAQVSAVDSALLSEREAALQRADLYATDTQHRLRLLADYQTEASALLDSEYSLRRQQAEAAGDDLAALDSELLTAKRTTLAAIEADYQRHIDTLNSEQRRHLDAVRAVDDQITNLHATTEERIRNLQRQTMSDYEVYQDRQSEIAELEAAARAALRDGEFTEAQQYSRRMQELADQLSGEVVVDDRVYVSKQQAVQNALRVVTQAANLEEQALAGLRDAHQNQADAAAAAATQTATALSDVQTQLTAVQSQLSERYALAIEFDDTAIVAAQAQLAALQLQRDAFAVEATRLASDLAALDAERARIAEAQAQLAADLQAQIAAQTAAAEQRAAEASADIQTPTSAISMPPELTTQFDTLNQTLQTLINTINQSGGSAAPPITQMNVTLPTGGMQSFGVMSADAGAVESTLRSLSTARLSTLG